MDFVSIFPFSGEIYRTLSAYPTFSDEYTECNQYIMATWDGYTEKIGIFTEFLLSHSGKNFSKFYD